MDPIDAPLIAGIENDPEVREAVKQLALDTVQSARDVLATGSPAIQLQMIRILLPGISRTVGKSDEKGDEELRKGLEKMYGDITKALGGDDGDD